MKGLRSTWDTEAAFRQETVLFAFLFPMAFIVGDTFFQTAILVASVLLVIIVEMLNSAIETVVDRIGEEANTLSGKAKDQGSAAVLIAILLMTSIWLSLIYENLI